MRLISTPSKLFPDAQEWDQSDDGVWHCSYDGIAMYIIDGFDCEPMKWSAQWGVDEFDEPELENEDLESANQAVSWLRDQFDPEKRETPKRFAPKLILYGFDFDKWVERWDLCPPEDIPCPKCGTPRSPTLPFQQGTLRGVLSKPCICGYSSKAPMSFISINGDLAWEA